MNQCFSFYFYIHVVHILIILNDFNIENTLSWIIVPEDACCGMSTESFNRIFMNVYVIYFIAIDFSA